MLVLSIRLGLRGQEQTKDYDIVIYNENNSVFYTMNTTKLVNEIDLPNITYDSKI